MGYFFKNADYAVTNYYSSSVLDIDYKKLYKDGIRALAFDVDGTIAPSGKQLDAELAPELTRKIKQSGIKKAFIASNSIRNLNPIAKHLKFNGIIQPNGFKGKPTKAYFQELIMQSKLEPKQIAMIGDRYLQDIWGAHRVGIKTILVEMRPEYAGKYDKIILRQHWQYRITRFIANNIAKKA